MKTKMMFATVAAIMCHATLLAGNVSVKGCWREDVRSRSNGIYVKARRGGMLIFR